MTSRSPFENSQPELKPAPEQPALEQLQPSISFRRLPGWRLWLPLLFQTALILAVPAQSAFTYITGKSVTLQTAPIDPSDLMRGSYQALSYDISNPDKLGSLPGGKHLAQSTRAGETIYVVLEAPPQNTKPPQPWKPVQVSIDRPTHLKANQVALEGHYNGLSIDYGLKTYYIPEDQQKQINAEISQAQQQNRRAFVVEAKVDAAGNAVPVSLWVGDRNYRF